ncbi:nuclear transport factor 2 family protein [Gallaecimonas sp. GXIMD4217]|uniref:nuclear transport factor 2 family protein n=1 Tax=Gallaecimonas sp. GXIMD4217 TaxID=3131927 RepID=UPI00311AD6D5
MTDNKAAARDFLALVVGGQVAEAFQRHMAEGFIHHNPYFPGDGPSLMQAMAEDAKASPDKSLDIRQLIAEGDKVVVHSHLHQVGGPGYALVHIFRFDGAKIAELWDLAQALPVTSPNEFGPF